MYLKRCPLLYLDLFIYLFIYLKFILQLTIKKKKEEQVKIIKSNYKIYINI